MKGQCSRCFAFSTCFTVCILAREAQAGATVVLGDLDGWTNKDNINYNKWLSNTKMKIGGTVRTVASHSESAL